MRWEIASISRPAEGESVSGDGVATHANGNRLLGVVTDGLGHGPGAKAASDGFLEFVAQDPERSLTQMMQEGSGHIASTRGAAVSLFRIDTERMTFDYCGIGNCHLHVHASARINPVSLPGIVGHRMRKVLAVELPLPEDGGLFIMCSDGISSRIHPERYEGLDAEAVMNAVLADHGKHHDDATVLVVRLA